MTRYRVIGSGYSCASEIPIGNELYYHCLKCDDFVYSRPKSSATCDCGNILIDADNHRLFISDFTLLEVAEIARFAPNIAGRLILNFNGDDLLVDPTEVEIQQAVLSLNTENGDAFVILSYNQMTYIQAAGDSKKGFVVEYQEGDLSRHFRAQRKLSGQELATMLIAYTQGDIDWKISVGWDYVQSTLK